MVLDPGAWDVLLCENLYGDLVSDLAAGLVGGLGLAPAGQFGDATGGMALFEPCHGSAPDIAGKDLANPCSLLLSAAMMLDFLGEPKAAGWVRSSVASVVNEGRCTTPDLGGTAGTQAMTEAVADEVERLRVIGSGEPLSRL
mmetsp:Transcript_23399/g.79262  ORF Transcript_23399/g.79262 Transcript_23399/m.79262 type:complete len:142 (+) Transcript_23399:558-983(+)